MLLFNYVASINKYGQVHILNKLQILLCPSILIDLQDLDSSPRPGAMEEKGFAFSYCVEGKFCYILIIGVTDMGENTVYTDGLHKSTY